jgi:hypothetical protein
VWSRNELSLSSWNLASLAYELFDQKLELKVDSELTRDTLFPTLKLFAEVR